MIKDLRLAARLLYRSKGWTAVVVLSLALGIGANIALFSWANGLLLRDVSVSDPRSLVRLRWAGPNDMATNSSDYGFAAKGADGLNVRTTFPYPVYQQFVAHNQTLTDLFVCAPYGRVNLVVDGKAEIARAFISTGNYYRVLGVVAAIGRTIGPEDDQPSAPPVALLSYRYWQTRFGGDRGVIGRTVRANNVPVTIVGVLPRAFTGVQEPMAEPPDVSLPLALHGQMAAGLGRDPLSAPTSWWLQMMGRTKPGVTPAQVQANLQPVLQQTARAGMDQYLAGLNDEERARASNADRTRIPQLRVEAGAGGVYDANSDSVRVVSILGAVVGLVLLIVCANVANLLLSRATARHREISIRLSVGATRGRLIRQMLTESVLLAAIGGALGILLAFWALEALRQNVPIGQPATLDWRTAGFMFGVTLATGLAFGLAPALTASRVSAGTVLKEQGRGVIGSRRLLSKALLVVQVALSLVLLVGAALFLRTLQNLRGVDVGFNPRNLALFTVSPGLNGYEPPRMLGLYGEMLQRLRAVPGVKAVALSNPPLLSGSENSTSIFIQGRAYTRGQRTSDSIHRVVVSPSFFEAMEMPLAAGRGFTDRDTETAPRVVVINEAAVKKYFPGVNPIGQRFGQSMEETGRLEIVGILRDAKYNSLRNDAPPTMYVSYLQNRPAVASFEIRTAGDANGAIPAIREAVRQIDANLPLANVSTQMEQIERRFVQEKVFAQALTWFGLLALLLASIGLFGLMSYGVARRTNEIGIRMALGAQRANVLVLVMRESMLLVALGVALGLGASLALGRFVRALLFGLDPADVSSIAAAVGVMVVVSALAAFLPARRASRVDPLVALRVE